MRKYLIVKKSRGKSTDEIDIQKLNEIPKVKTGQIRVSNTLRFKPKYNNNKRKALRKR